MPEHKASQSPVDAMPASPTGHHDAMGISSWFVFIGLVCFFFFSKVFQFRKTDVSGNAWEWTEDHFNPLEGFEVHYVGCSVHSIQQVLPF